MSHLLLQNAGACWRRHPPTLEQTGENMKLLCAAVRAAEDFQQQLQKARQSTTEVKKQLAGAQEQLVAERQNKETLQAPLRGRLPR
eukprot:s7040_g2.t1